LPWARVQVLALIQTLLMASLASFQAGARCLGWDVQGAGWLAQQLQPGRTRP
jgi:hypothetical protein